MLRYTAVALLVLLSVRAASASDWQRLEPLAGTFELAGAGRTGDRLYFFGEAAGQPWVVDGYFIAHFDIPELTSMGRV
jgi:hypothetical protein